MSFVIVHDDDICEFSQDQLDACNMLRECIDGSLPGTNEIHVTCDMKNAREIRNYLGTNVQKRQKGYWSAFELKALISLLETARYLICNRVIRDLENEFQERICGKTIEELQNILHIAKDDRLSKQELHDIKLEYF